MQVFGGRGSCDPTVGCDDGSYSGGSLSSSVSATCVWGDENCVVACFYYKVNMKLFSDHIVL